MDISASIGMVEDLSDPEELAIPNPDSSDNRSSVESDPDNGLDITIDLIEKFDQGIGPWLLEVLTYAIRDGEQEVASVYSYLIKRENIQTRDNKRKSFRKALKDEDPMLNVMFRLPKIFHPHGPVNPDYLQPLGHCFSAHEIRSFSNTNDATEHPANRAWILLIRDLVVDGAYRRLGIGGNMIRKTIQEALKQCAVAGRPLLVAVQPKRIDEFTDEEWADMDKMIYDYRVNDVFWENIGFKWLGSRFSGFTAPWYFWGLAFDLPPKKRITIPNDIESRNSRTETPPPRAHPPRDYNRPNPHDWFPTVQGERVVSLIKQQTPLRPLRQDRPKDMNASDYDAASSVWWFDNPDDPLISPEESQRIRGAMQLMDNINMNYRVRPNKEPVQVQAAQSPTSQPKCPFKAPSGEDDDEHDGFPDLSDIDSEALENCSYEELVALGFVHGESDTSDVEM
ncbi:hypothetical protein N0V93_006747 [Gnomoniopsis smithogilvyi]|uniref:Uncharacterized protein n=1 Tax=Gnomoniopsis smithogilvyi TaxID=1191159 RepID=A0A9W8YQA2_9PEZI|nr:hypothetical protein N0V93_006747 [Gnomoniopsis smithogilvyi]